MKKFNAIYESIMDDLNASYVDYQLGEDTRDLQNAIDSLFENINIHEKDHKIVHFKRNVDFSIDCKIDCFEIKILKKNQVFWVKDYPTEDQFINIAKQQLKEEVETHFTQLLI